MVEFGKGYNTTVYSSNIICNFFDDAALFPFLFCFYLFMFWYLILCVPPLFVDVYRFWGKIRNKGTNVYYIYYVVIQSGKRVKVQYIFLYSTYSVESTFDI